MRTVNDVHHITAAAKTSKNIVIIGSSFIGLESAAALKAELKDEVNIVVVSQSKVPFEKTLGKDVGRALQKLHESKGIRFVLDY